MGAIAGRYKYFQLDNPVMFRFALCTNTQLCLRPAAHDQNALWEQSLIKQSG